MTTDNANPPAEGSPAGAGTGTVVGAPAWGDGGGLAVLDADDLSSGVVPEGVPITVPPFAPPASRGGVDPRGAPCVPAFAEPSAAAPLSLSPDPCPAAGLGVAGGCAGGGGTGVGEGGGAAAAGPGAGLVGAGGTETHAASVQARTSGSAARACPLPDPARRAGRRGAVLLNRQQELVTERDGGDRLSLDGRIEGLGSVEPEMFRNGIELGPRHGFHGEGHDLTISSRHTLDARRPTGPGNPHDQAARVTVHDLSAEERRVAILKQHGPGAGAVGHVLENRRIEQEVEGEPADVGGGRRGADHDVDLPDICGPVNTALQGDRVDYHR